MRQVFLSSTSRDLTAYRDAAYQAIEGLDGFHCVRMEDFGARTDAPDKFCRAKIAECDVAVLLVGLCHGSGPEGSTQSYTEREYLEAKEKGIPCLVILSEDGDEYPGYYRETSAQWDAQQQFRARVNSDVIRAIFTIPDQLAAKVTQALANWATTNPEQKTLADSPILSATLSGTGVIAQQGGVAAGAGGIAIGGNVGGDIVAAGGKKEVHYHCGECPKLADQAVIEPVSKSAEAELQPILKRRILVPEQSREEIKGLVGRFGNDGDLCFASSSIHIEVLCWAARLHATQAETLNEAIGYRDQARTLAPSVDVRIVEAWILATQGDVDSALRIARDLDTADGRSNLFALLRNNRGNDVALAWWAEQQGQNDPNFFTGTGWHNVAVTLALSGRWQEAITCLASARVHADDCPTMLLLEGLLNAAMLLPLPIRASALHTPPYLMEVATIEGEEAERYRTHAMESFASAVQTLHPLGLNKEVQHGRLMLFWLRLTDPRPAVVEEARREIEESSRDCRQAIPLLPMIRQFALPFDPGPTRQYLEARKRLGGLGPEETLAEFMLALMTMPPGELADLIEREEQRFTFIFPRVFLTGCRIEALARSGQFTRAVDILTERKADLTEIEATRLQTLIDAHTGVDVRSQLEALYRQTESLGDLHQLVMVLGKDRDWGALRPRLEELFRLEATTENAKRLVHCLTQMPVIEDQAIIAFLEDNRDLVAHCHDLASAQAWSLFRMGRWQDAGTFIGRLLQERSVASDLILDTNLALQTGDWEHFAVIVDREWPRRAEHDSETLLRLATLAAETDMTEERAVELARLAAEKAPDDPQILINAWALASQVGREEAADPGWISRAKEGSSDAGPVWQVDLRKIIEEIMPAHRERALKVESALVRGEIPLHFAAAALNLPLSNILLDLPRRNAEERDGRKRAIIPIFSGSRNIMDVNPEWVVGFDVTSLLVLFHLGILEQTLKAVNKVALAPDTMLFLLSERRRARFHQPSRVKKAEEVRSLMDNHRLKVADSLPEPPAWLTEEVGRDLAQLLEAAKFSNGRVVHPLPMHKLRSFQEEQAELGEYAPLVISTVAFARLLNDMGWVDAATYCQARGHLFLHDQDHEVEMESELLNRPVFLDDLALSYLHDAGLLLPIASADVDLRVHPSFRAEQGSLIEANRHGERLSESLNKVRGILRDALISGKVFFLPHHQRRSGHEHGDSWLEAPALATFLNNVAPCDAICCDDRFLNRNAMLTDQQGHVVPVLCTLDILRFLESKKYIRAEEREDMLHRLREGCFGLIPLSSKELERRLCSAYFNAKGHMQESPELRAIRQTMMRLRSLDMVQQPVETPYLDKLRLECILVLLRLWRDEARDPNQTVALSDWLWRNVAPSPLDWYRTARGNSGMRPVIEAFGNHLAMLLNGGMVTMDAHMDAFRKWVDGKVVAPLLPMNSNLLSACLPLLKSTIQGVVKNVATRQEKVMFAEHLCNLQPEPVRRLLFEDKAFCVEMGLSPRSLLTVGGIVQISRGKLFEGARRLLKTREGQNLSDESGRSFKLAVEKNSVLLEDLPGREESWAVEFPDLMVFSPQREERVHALEQVMQALGPATLDFSAIMAAASERELRDDEATLVITENLTGVTAQQKKIQRAFAADHAGLFEFVPQDLGYYERYCGPNPVDESPEEYIHNRLPDYRKIQLMRDLGAGLDICLLGSLRDDLTPGAWIEHESHDVVWAALMQCEFTDNPFSLLGALDITLLRQEDDRFRGLAKELMTSLLKDSLPRPDGIDAYQMMPLFADLVLNVLNTLEGGPTRPPFWKRMCAWMHAGFLLSVTSQYRFDLPSLKNWANSQMTTAGEYAKTLDLRREPMFSATVMSAEALRQEVLGRLVLLRSRHESAGRVVPRGKEIESTITTSEKNTVRGWWRFAGPLDGHLLPMEYGRQAILEAEAARLVDQLGDDPAGPLFPALAHLSQVFDLRGVLLNHTRVVVSKMFFSSTDGNNDSLLGKLPDGCVVAAAQRDEELAKLVGSAALTAAPHARSEQEIQTILQCLLLAGAAFANEDEWSIWIEVQLFQLEACLPIGEPSRIFLYLLGELKKVVDLTHAIHCRAEGLASTAISVYA